MIDDNDYSMSGADMCFWKQDNYTFFCYQRKTDFATILQNVFAQVLVFFRNGRFSH